MSDTVRNPSGAAIRVQPTAAVLGAQVHGADLRALSDFNHSVAINPDVGEAHLMRGIAFLQLGRLGEANDALTQAISLNVVRPERAYYYRGAANEEAGNTHAAYADYRRAADLAPGWRSPQTELARFQVRSN